MTDNPFKAGVYGGVQTYHVTADDRLRVVGSFDRPQCDAALLVQGLQKTVAGAVHRRIRHLNRVATVLTFEDHGQDFLRWELDAKGTVIGCEPFQASIWCGNVVTDHGKLVVGETLRYKSPGDASSTDSIRYPLVRIERKGGAA